MIVRDQKGNDFQKGDPCGACGSPRRRLFAVSRGAQSKGSRLQRSRDRKCVHGHVSVK